jgi:2-keto-3-deoxy-L-rhamnonate aldolase
MDASERVLLVSSIRKTLDNEGIKIPLIVGCGQQSKRATLQTIKEAKGAGGDFALVLPPSYWPTAMTKGNVTGYFKELADDSEMPILVYNFPLVANGIMVDSDQLIELAQHDNIVGCKLTCGVSLSSISLLIICTAYSGLALADDRISETSIERQITLILNISQS